MAVFPAPPLLGVSLTPPTLLTKEDPHLVDGFSTRVTEHIRTLSAQLTGLFDDTFHGRVGLHVQEVVRDLFDQWLIASLSPGVAETERVVVESLEKGLPAPRTKRELVRLLPFNAESVERMVEFIQSHQEGAGVDRDMVESQVWQLFNEKRATYLAQTANAIVCRMVMGLVIRDKVRGRGRPPLQVDRTDDYWRLVSDYRLVFPSIFALNEFDWWFVSPLVPLEAGERRTLEATTRGGLGNAMRDAWRTLSDYDYSEVNLDVWKDVYLNVAGEGHIRAFGFVPTPDEIVDLILDLVQYESSTIGLCSRSLLDPACGTGTFAVEALVRLRAHLEKPMSCHSTPDREARWEIARRRLDTVVSSIVAIDVHPFASFLTSINLTFLIMDWFLDVVHHDPSFSLQWRVITHDSLATSPLIPSPSAENGRLLEAQRRQYSYMEAMRERYDFVVGNPPWGGVLRGALGPLGDLEGKRRWERLFPNQKMGKTDIYIFFIARALRLCKDGGSVGLITQNTWTTMDFGAPIRGELARRAKIIHFVNLGSLGPVVFPRFTNYPSILTFQRIDPDPDHALLEINVRA